jgi:L-fuconolactonase
MIDAHQHFWKLARGDYAWLTPDLAPLYRDFLPGDLEPLRRAAGIEASVLVQAAPTSEETRFLLEIAETTPWVVGVVGWVDLEAADAADQLVALAERPALRGIRPMIQDIADPDWMLRPALEAPLRALSELGLRFDALVKPQHLPNLARLLERHPRLPVVIDHGGKPDIAGGGFGGWAEDMARLAQSGCCCKLSGLVTEAAPGWTDEALRPYVDHLLQCFGSERLMWGSDWPVVELAGGYAAWRTASLRLLEGLDESARAGVLGENARRFYGLPPREKETR